MTALIRMHNKLHKTPQSQERLGDLPLDPATKRSKGLLTSADLETHNSNSINAIYTPLIPIHKKFSFLRHEKASSVYSNHCFHWTFWIQDLSESDDGKIG